MNRKLSKEEKELSEGSLKRLDKEHRELTTQLNYNLALIEKQNFLRGFDNVWRSFLREQKDNEDKNIIEQMKEILKQKEETINNLQKQIKEGVEPKKVEYTD